MTSCSPKESESPRNSKREEPTHTTPPLEPLLHKQGKCSESAIPNKPTHLLTHLHLPHTHLFSGSFSLCVCLPSLEIRVLRLQMRDEGSPPVLLFDTHIIHRQSRRPSHTALSVRNEARAFAKFESVLKWLCIGSCLHHQLCIHSPTHSLCGSALS